MADFENAPFSTASVFTISDLFGIKLFVLVFQYLYGNAETQLPTQS